MKSSALLRRVAAMSALFLAALPAYALVVNIDQFSAVVNGSPLFNDGFANGTTPSQETSAYFVNGAFPEGAEIGGLLTLDTAWGGLTANAQGGARQALIVTRLTNNQSASVGFALENTFALDGVFDLVAPAGPLPNSYGIRFVESIPNQAVQRLLQLDVGWTPTEGVVIRLVFQDFVNGTIDVLESLAFAPDSGDDQIRFRLERDNALNNLVFGSYAFGDNGTFDLFTRLNTEGVAMFQSSDFLRGQFFASTAVAAAVPEPSTLALLGAAMLALTAARRRRA